MEMNLWHHSDNCPSVLSKPSKSEHSYNQDVLGYHSYNYLSNSELPWIYNALHKGKSLPLFPNCFIIFTLCYRNYSNATKSAFFTSYLVFSLCFYVVGPASSFALFQSGIMGPNCLPEYKITTRRRVHNRVNNTYCRTKRAFHMRSINLCWPRIGSSVWCINPYWVRAYGYTQNTGQIHIN